MVFAAPVMVAFALLATGCGSSSDTPRVASVPDATTSAATSTSANTQGSSDDADTSDGRRPLLRVDDSPARVTQLWNAYNTCLLHNGAHKPGSDEIVAAPGTRGDPGVLVGNPVPAKARAACLQVRPRGPLELDASTNPNFHDESLAYVACLRRHGEYVRLLNDHDIDWTYVAGHSVPDDNGVFEPKCLVEAFGGH